MNGLCFRPPLGKFIGLIASQVYEVPFVRLTHGAHDGDGRLRFAVLNARVFACQAGARRCDPGPRYTHGDRGAARAGAKHRWALPARPPGAQSGPMVVARSEPPAARAAP